MNIMKFLLVVVLHFGLTDNIQVYHRRVRREREEVIGAAPWVNYLLVVAFCLFGLGMYYLVFMLLIRPFVPCGPRVGD